MDLDKKGLLEQMTYQNLQVDYCKRVENNQRLKSPMVEYLSQVRIELRTPRPKGIYWTQKHDIA